jgi:glucokinase
VEKISSSRIISAPEMRLNFSGSDRVMVGIDLGGTKVFGALSDLNGCILHEKMYDHHKTQAEESLNLVFRVIDELLNEAMRRDIPVCGIGIGVPGIVIPETGVVSLAPALEWQGFPLLERVKERYSDSIVIENDVNLAALGEFWFGEENRHLKNLVLIAIGTGIGAGIVLNGNIYSGTHHMAGEIGYLLLDRSHLGQRYPDFGALEQVVSGTGIADRARTIKGGKITSKSGDQVTAEDVFSAARQHEIWAETILSLNFAH